MLLFLLYVNNFEIVNIHAANLSFYFDFYNFIEEIDKIFLGVMFIPNTPLSAR